MEFFHQPSAFDKQLRIMLPRLPTASLAPKPAAASLVWAAAGWLRDIKLQLCCCAHSLRHTRRETGGSGSMQKFEQLDASSQQQPSHHSTMQKRVILLLKNLQ